MFLTIASMHVKNSVRLNRVVKLISLYHLVIYRTVTGDNYHFSKDAPENSKYLYSCFSELIYLSAVQDAKYRLKNYDYKSVDFPGLALKCIKYAISDFGRRLSEAELLLFHAGEEKRIVLSIIIKDIESFIDTLLQEAYVDDISKLRNGLMKQYNIKDYEIKP